jgi:hypothetical protein
MKCESGNFKIRIGGLGWKHKRPGFDRPIAEGKNRNKISRDQKMRGQEVNEVYWINRIKKEWHQIVTDIKTGKIIHEDNESLPNKNKK